ncbi:hypothetical protein ACS0TY_031606 [Phlomoides rotata]
MGFKGNFRWSWVNYCHICIKFTLEVDFTRMWMKPFWMIRGCPMRVFKWTPDFDISHEAPIAPVWVRFPGLPVHLIYMDALFTIASEFGKPLQVDRQTAEHSRLTYARVCIEMDLLQEPITEFEMDIFGVSHTLRVVYENRPKHCTGFRHVGHEQSVCYVTRDRPRPQRRGRPPRRDASRGRSQVGTSRPPNKGKTAVDGSAQGAPTPKQAQKSQQEEQEWRTVGNRTTGMLAKSFVERPPQAQHTYYQHTPEVSSATLGDGIQFSVLEEGEIGIVESKESDDSEGSSDFDGSTASNADDEEDDDEADNVGEQQCGLSTAQHERRLILLVPAPMFLQIMVGSLLYPHQPMVILLWALHRDRLCTSRRFL